MFKVVIVDDEPIIVEGLKRMIKWDKYDCEVVGTASSGQEGIRMVREKNPDILLTDIRMPNMDGLTMIAALRSEYSEMEITILTGYREFEYARTALKLGVHRFLLKPSKMDELDEAISTMTEKLLERRGRGSASKDENNPAGNFIVDSAINYMRKHYKEKLQLSDVAEHVYVSMWHLSKLLNGQTGKSFSDILNGIRVDKAKELLSDPSLHVVDIAEMVGFQDTAHFARVFKKHTGMSANEYRNMKKQRE